MNLNCYTHYILTSKKEKTLNEVLSFLSQPEENAHGERLIRDLRFSLGEEVEDISTKGKYTFHYETQKKKESKINLWTSSEEIPPHGVMLQLQRMFPEVEVYYLWEDEYNQYYETNDSNGRYFDRFVAEVILFQNNIQDNRILFSKTEEEILNFVEINTKEKFSSLKEIELFPWNEKKKVDLTRYILTDYFNNKVYEKKIV